MPRPHVNKVYLANGGGVTIDAIKGAIQSWCNEEGVECLANCRQNGRCFIKCIEIGVSGLPGYIYGIPIVVDGGRSDAIHIKVN